MRLWVLVYDIADDKRRRLLAKHLGQRLQRVQESVFEGWLTMMELEEVMAQARQLVDVGEDRLRAYPLALRKEARCRIHGQQSSVEKSNDYWIV